MRLGRGDLRRPRISENAAHATAAWAAARRRASFGGLETIASGGQP
jgi:hypothetical protein